MTTIRAALTVALIACVAWGQQVAREDSRETRTVGEPQAQEARRAVSAGGRDTLTVTRVPSKRDLVAAKAQRCWATYAPWSYDPELVEFFIDECERWGLLGEWRWLLAYGMANFGLRVGATAPGRCYGPFDCKWPYVSRAHAAHVLDGPWREAALCDPYVNTACHVGQAAEYHRRTGRTGMALLRTVFYPAAPWGRATNAWAPRWEKWDRKFRECIQQGYEAGKLP